ncbi:type I-F CRISPR-associated protein Csy1 [uncultured Pluralibacter sp.]|uniref:type I-F CRISPR-associated protein Csy1 n=1 Tax=uncultured Pluralibacter sp. TaxID=1490864 RepID=UPI002632DB29|nr:type I-F CRISPR-associated protein Csy1 [uncultured Pluralibacter sp.]
MEQENLITFITGFIADRRQTKAEAFEKEAQKRLAQGEPLSAIAEERQALEERYRSRAWLADAARRAGQISLVTHAAKFTHGDAKSSSLYSETTAADGYLTTSSLTTLSADAVGNAAALDVAKLLQTEVDGDSLLACLRRGDRQPLKAFAENDAELALWVEGFEKALTAGEPASHKLAKQVYFPVDGGYHLLNPLFATSLAHAVQANILDARFGEAAKEARTARREKRQHPEPVVFYPNLAEMHFGGTKPQNISALNSARGGRMSLLPAAPPVWTPQHAAPRNLRSVFAARGDFSRQARPVLMRLTHRLNKPGGKDTRQARDGYIDELIDMLFVHAAAFQQEAWQGWSADNPELPRHQQLWLDPWRGESDAAFRAERESGDWQAQVAEDFARWLNQSLKKAQLDVGSVERREWRTRPLFRGRMREMDAILQEVMR